MTAPEELVVRKSITVACDREHAFRVFTEEIASWWPLATHSVFEERAATCGIEGRVGGRIFERAADGDESVWGTITAWDPPKHMAFTWHPGHDEQLAGDVEVRFAAVGASTRVELTHRGFEKRGAEAAAIRDGYETGWGYVLGDRYAPYAAQNRTG